MALPAPPKRPLSEVGQFLRSELRHLGTIHASDRLWQMPVAAALATGLQLFVGAWLNRLGYATAAALGGLVFLYLHDVAVSPHGVDNWVCVRNDRLLHTRRALPCRSRVHDSDARRDCGAGENDLPLLWPQDAGEPVLYHGGFDWRRFPAELLQTLAMVGLFTMGTLLACLIALLYGLWTLRIVAPARLRRCRHRRSTSWCSIPW